MRNAKLYGADRWKAEKLELDKILYNADNSTTNLTKGEIKDRYITGGTLQVMMQAKPR